MVPWVLQQHVLRANWLGGPGFEPFMRNTWCDQRQVLAVDELRIARSEGSGEKVAGAYTDDAHARRHTEVRQYRCCIRCMHHEPCLVAFASTPWSKPAWCL